jgi:hypothetical protein
MMLYTEVLENTRQVTTGLTAASHFAFAVKVFGICRGSVSCG